MVPSIYHTWNYTRLLGQQRRECQLFRDSEPSLIHTKPHTDNTQQPARQACSWRQPISQVNSAAASAAVVVAAAAVVVVAVAVVAAAAVEGAT